MNLPSRNQPCPCGSGKKYKHCCANRGGAVSTSNLSPHKQFQVLVETGLEAHQSGDFASAAVSYDRALVLEPNDPGLLGLKGMLLYQQEAHAKARPLIEHALRLNPRDARIHNYLAQVLDALGEHDKAQLEYIEAVRLEPRYMEAWHNAGKSLLLHHKTDEAVFALKQALALAPNDPEILFGMAEAFFLDRKFIEAEQCIKNSANNGAMSAPGYVWLSVIGRELGRIQESTAFETLAVQSPDHDAVFNALITLGKLELHIGNLIGAEHCLNLARDIKPEAAESYIELAATRKFVESDRSLVGQMAAMLDTASGLNKRGLEFALGKIYTDLGEYDQSFHHYRVANDFVRSSVDYDKAKYIAWVDEQIALFQIGDFEKYPHGSQENTPVLIVGTPRSGTTLTESIISAHGSIDGAGEMDYWSKVMPHVRKVLPDSFTKALAKRLADEYLMFMRKHSRDAQRVTDKMPSNFQYLGLIHAVLPNAKIIHIKRHPIDACLSIYFQNFSDGHAYKWDLESLVSWYEQYQRLMVHWREVLPAGTLFEFWYEDLIEDTEGVSREIMNFLGLDWQVDQLNFHKQERSVYTASKWQARQPIYKTSTERWRRYEKHIGPLMKLLKYAKQ